MNYEAATNRELNIMLANLLGLKACEKKTIELDCMMNQLKRDFLDVVNDDSIFADGEFIDFCTDWGATMPLGIEHGISLINDDIGGNYSIMIDDSDTIWCRKEDVLRVIVICLIKKLEQPQ